MNSRSLNVAAEYPARFNAAFEGAVVDELVGEDPIGLADERVFWTLNQVRGIVRYLASELLDASCAPFFFVRAANVRGVGCRGVKTEQHVVINPCKR
eukprot:3289052-Pleurochrysis_carterae.AAC.1